MDFSDIIVKIKPSIAYIVANDINNKLLGTGSGFVYGKKRLLVTCNHVVKDASLLYIKFPDTTSYIGGKVIIRDDEHDLALLRFDDESRVPLQLSDHNKIKEGMPVLYSGYPLISENMSTHQGIISAIIKDITGITSYMIDGTINSGNSGCPLMNIDGEVIGVINAKVRVHNDLLEKVEKMSCGAVSLHSVDLVEIYQALITNVQLGSGFAVPASYIPDHKEIEISVSENSQLAKAQTVRLKKKG